MDLTFQGGLIYARGQINSRIERRPPKWVYKRSMPRFLKPLPSIFETLTFLVDDHAAGR
jgi:hypothetical protein